MRCKNGYRQDPPKSGNCVPKTQKKNEKISPKKKSMSRKNMTSLKEQETQPQQKGSKMEYGIMIHYGLYSYYGYDDINSAKRRKAKNGSEWYYKRLFPDNDYKPTAGYTATQKYHETNYGDARYFDNLDKITTDENKVKEWVTIAKNKGASYIILTAKDHDGLCLFDTKTPQCRKSRMDICKVFSDECKKQDMPFGFYYSWFEFEVPFTFTIYYLKTYCVPQIKELLEYKPDYIWFDGDWILPKNSVQEKIKGLMYDVKTKDVLINDRIGKNNIDEANYRVFTDLPPIEEVDGIAWQYVDTIGRYSWGYNKMQTKSDYKTKEELYDLYNRVTSLGGTFLINVGPNENAEIIEEELEALDFAKL